MEAPRPWNYIPKAIYTWFQTSKAFGTRLARFSTNLFHQVFKVVLMYIIVPMIFSIVSMRLLEFFRLGMLLCITVLCVCLLFGYCSMLFMETAWGARIAKSAES